MVTGFLEVITGPVFSGKTSTLINRIQRTPGKFLVLKPFDELNNEPISQIVSHSEESFPALAILNDAYLSEIANYEWIFIDNIHSFNKNNFQGNILKNITSMLGKGAVVTCTSLNYDYFGKPFPITDAILKMADAITMLTAKCSICGTDANFSQKIQQNICPRCSLHYKP